MSERIQYYLDRMEPEIKRIVLAAMEDLTSKSLTGPTLPSMFESLVASGVAAAVQELLPKEVDEEKVSHLNTLVAGTFQGQQAIASSLVVYKRLAQDSLNLLNKGIESQVDCAPEFIEARNQLAAEIDKTTSTLRETIYRSLKEAFGVEARILDGEDPTDEQCQSIGLIFVSTAMHFVCGFLFDPPQPPGACLCLACRGHREMNTSGTRQISDVFKKAIELYGSYPAMLEALGRAHVADMRKHVEGGAHDKIDPEAAKNEVAGLFTRLTGGAGMGEPSEG